VLDRPDALEVVALAEGFALDNPLNCKKMERLLAILYEDPNPTVRDKVFVEMMRHRDELELDFDVLVVELIQGHFTRVVSIHGQLQSNQELSQEATKLSDVTEARACIVLNELGPCAVAAAYWLREHGESKESIAALSDVMTDGGRKELTAVASEALAAIRSRLGGSVGGLTVVEEHDAGRLSVVDEQGQLSVGEGELSVADDEQRKKRLAAEARKQRS
jgi:hypothetical protein